MAGVEGLRFYKDDIGKVRYVGNTRVSSARENNPGNASDVAKHEAAHAVTALELGIGIKEVSVVPNPRQGSLGHVKTERPNATVAMAAKSNGGSGTSHDEMVAAIVGDPFTAEQEARKILSGKKKELNEFGYELDKRRRMSGSEAEKVYELVKSPEIIVYIAHPANGLRTERLRMKNGVLDIPPEWFPAQNKFSLN